jgi:hypothetical protein
MTSNSKSSTLGNKNPGFVSRLSRPPSDDDDKRQTAPENPPKGTMMTSPHPAERTHRSRSRRAEAENRLQEAATALSKSMSKSPAKVPDAIGLERLDSIKDVEGTAKRLEYAIDGIIDARAIKANADSRRVWKDCIKHWYKAMYPYVRFGLKEVKVRFLFSVRLMD